MNPLDPDFLFPALIAIIGLFASIAIINTAFRTARAVEAMLVESIKHNTLLDEQVGLLRKQNDALTQIAVKLSANAPKGSTTKGATA